MMIALTDANQHFVFLCQIFDWIQWILDVLVCNWLGLYLGMKTCEYFEMKQYSWQGLAEIPTLKGKMKRTMAQFTPKSWTKFEWDSTKSFKSYCTVIFILTMVSGPH